MWTNLHQGIRETYLQAEAPSLFLVIPRLSDQTAKLAPNEGFANFAVINVSAVEIDWLLLGGGVHKRVKFKLAGPQVDASWCTRDTANSRCLLEQTFSTQSKPDRTSRRSTVQMN